MASAISDIKKKRGRPPKAGGIYPGVFVRLPPKIIEAVDQDAQARNMTRSDVIREAVEEAVRHKLKKAKGKAR
jgi:type IV secretory pathway TrbF-like protein